MHQVATGNRSAFLRETMKQMEAIERAEQLAELQTYGADRSAAAGLDTDDAVAVVRRVLKRSMSPLTGRTAPHSSPR